MQYFDQKRLFFTIYCCFQFLISFGQSPILIENQPFDNVIKIDSSILVERREVALTPMYSNYANKKDLVYFFFDKYGKGKQRKTLISWKTKFHNDLKKILLDTTDNCNLVLKFNKHVSLQSKKDLIREFEIDIKRTLMLWHERSVDGNEVYFVGHRGGLMNHFQENTDDILKYSKKSGISFMEIDVVISKDKVPFVGHDWKYLSSKLRIKKSSDSIAISKARFPDGQRIMFMDELFNEHQFLILDLIHNSIGEQQNIVKYLYKHFPEEIKSHAYIQVDKFKMYTFIKKLDRDLIVSYNLRAANTGKWRSNWINKIEPKMDEIEMFVVNPSTVVNEKFLKKFDCHVNKIIPVISKDNVKEIRRMTKLGFKFIMIDDVIYVDHKLKEPLKKKK